MDAEKGVNTSPPSVDYGDGDEEEPLAAEGPDSAAASHAVPAETEIETPEATMRPRRVEQALKESKTFEDYRKKRPFKFLHMYSGPNDPLGQAIKMEAAKNRLNVVVLSLDNQLDPELDLADPGGFQIMKEDVNKGEWDFTHAGFPCGSFSMARHNGVPGPAAAGQGQGEHLWTSWQQSTTAGGGRQGNPHGYPGCGDLRVTGEQLHQT